MQDTDLKTRLAAIEARAPGAQQPPELLRSPPGWRHRLFASVAFAPGLVLAIAVTATAGGAIAGILAVRGYPGAQNPGQPLAGANLECMSPPAAASYLATNGYTDVVWQVETGSVSENTDSTTQQETPPEHGFVVPGAFLGDGRLIMIVDQRVGATGVGACYGNPMP